MGVQDVRVGDLFESSAQTLVNTVNCVGVMGKGIALAFKKRFPDMYADYARRCELGEVELGAPYLWTGSEPWVLNFPTKDHWRSVSRLEDIERGLVYLHDHYEGWGIESLAVPPLGCGHGGLDWRVVGPTLHRHLDRLNIPVMLYAPHGTPAEQRQLDFFSDRKRREREETPSSVPASSLALIEVLSRITSKRVHPPVGRIKFQKLAYFATVAGIPTDLTFTRGSYGPFSDELKPRVITRLVNNGLLEEERRGPMFEKKVGRTFRDARSAHASALDGWEEEIERVSDLMMRMDTQDAELAATAHYAYADLCERLDETPTEDQVLREVLRWKQRRRPKIDEVAAASTIRSLNWLGWIDAKPSPDLPLPEEPFVDA